MSDDLTEVEEQLQFFKKVVTEYLKLDNEIKKLSKAIKDRKQKKENLEETIITYLQCNDISQINLNERQLVCRTSKRTSGLSQKNLDSAFHEYFTNSEEAKKIIEFIMSKKTVKHTPKLRLLKKGKKNKNKISPQITNQDLLNMDDNSNVPEHLKYLYSNM